MPDTFNCSDVKFVADVIPNVETPEDTLSWVTEAIPPITLVAIPAFVAKVAIPAFVAKVAIPALVAKATLRLPAVTPFKLNAVVAKEAVDAVPIKDTAVTIPEALIFLTTAKSFSVNWTDPAARRVPVGNCVEPIPTA